MPHADAALFAAGISKSDAYKQVELQLEGLFEGQRHWISNLANTSSLLWALFHALPPPLSSVNWAGFYVRSDLYPRPQAAQAGAQAGSSGAGLLLAPFAGLPACQAIPLPEPGSGRAPGVCAAAFLTGETQVVADVHARAGHIACDARTRSEIVVPVRREGEGGAEVVAVLDIDCEEVRGFDEEDREALERIARLVGRSCDW